MYLYLVGWVSHLLRVFKHGPNISVLPSVLAWLSRVTRFSSGLIISLGPNVSPGRGVSHDSSVHPSNVSSGLSHFL